MYVIDGLKNLVANIGTAKDKLSHSFFSKDRTFDRESLSAAYQTDWLSRKIVDIVPQDMLRKGRTFNDLEESQLNLLEDEQQRIKAKWNILLAMQWARLFGGSAIMIVIDGDDPREPLEVDRIRPGSLSHLYTFDRSGIHPQGIEQVRVESPNFGMPEYYKVRNGQAEIHHTRFIRFDGAIIPYDDLIRNQYWHNSVLESIHDSIINFTMTQKSAAGMVSETNVDVVRVKGLMQYLSTPEGENKLRDRFSLAKQLKAFNNMMLLDTEEELTHNTNTFAGLPELFDRFSEIVSGASDIPVTRLMGRSPAGLTATGESDLRNYYDMIASKQDAQLRENLEYLDKIVAANIGLNSENLDFTFNPLWQMSELDQSAVDFNNAQRDQIYLMNNVLSEEIVAKQLMNQDTYVALNDEFINKLESEQSEDDFSEESLNKIKAIINGTGNTANNQPTNKPE